MRDRTSIFMLHRLDDPANGIHGHTIEFIKTSLIALRNSGAKFVSLRTLVEAWRSGTPIDPDWLVFTMDDGFADQATLVREAFTPMDCPVTIFLITGFLDSYLWPWDDQLAFAFKNSQMEKADVVIAGKRFSLDLSSPTKRIKAINAVRGYCKKIADLDPYAVVDLAAESLGTLVPTQPPPWFQPMTWDTARALEREGAEFGPHSVTHRVLSRLSDERARFELEISWSRLKQELNNPLPIFAWPTGRSEDFSGRDIELARALGFEACMASDPDYAYRASNDPAALYHINRFALPTNLNTVLRYGSWLERARQLLPI